MLRRLFALLLALAMVCSLTACGGGEKPPSGNSDSQQSSQPAQQPDSTPTPGAAQTGKETSSEEAAREIASGFGSYNGSPIVWRVLKIDLANQRALLISGDCIRQALFHETEPTEELTWETSDLRKWLGGEFYETAFTEAQKEKILTVTNPADTNSESGAQGGNDTTDQVFILSASEMAQYFADDADMAGLLNGESTSYWTRTPGDNTQGYVCTYADSGGGLYLTGNWATSTEVAVRPAIWVSLSDTTAAPPADGAETFSVPEVDAAKRTTDLNVTTLKMDKKTYAPGEAITVTLKWTGTPDPSAWVGIIPANVPHGDEYVNDDADVAYIYLDGHEGDRFVFDDELSEPLAPGLYTIRVNENDGGGAELAWCAFAVSGSAVQQEPAAEETVPSAGQIRDFTVGIDGVPTDWQKGIGNELFGMEVSSDGSDFTTGYLQKFGSVTGEDYAAYKAYFDALEFDSEADGIYNCGWGQFQLSRNDEYNEITVTWYVN